MVWRNLPLYHLLKCLLPLCHGCSKRQDKVLGFLKKTRQSTRSGVTWARGLRLWLRVGLSPNGLPASRFRDEWQIWDGKRETCFSPSRIFTFLPVHNSFVPARPKCDVFGERCDQKRHKVKKILSCARASRSSQKCDKCNAWHFLSPEKVTNVTSLVMQTGKLQPVFIRREKPVLLALLSNLTIPLPMTYQPHIRFFVVNDARYVE